MAPTDAEAWDQARKHLNIDTAVTGTVTSVQPYGVFVKLEEGPFALLLIPYFERQPLSENDYRKVGDRLTARIAVIDDAKRQIALTQIDPDPRMKMNQRPAAKTD
jgi:ribosomal protein S1